jgi:hypothetical protein
MVVGIAGEDGKSAGVSQVFPVQEKWDSLLRRYGSRSRKPPRIVYHTPIYPASAPPPRSRALERTASRRPSSSHKSHPGFPRRSSIGRARSPYTARMGRNDRAAGTSATLTVLSYTSEARVTYLASMAPIPTSPLAITNLITHGRHACATRCRRTLDCQARVMTWTRDDESDLTWRAWTGMTG